MGKLIMIVGIVLVGIGLLVHLGLPIGRLPGDVTIRRGNSTFYFPIVTCVVLSLVFSLVMYLLRR